MFARVKVPPLLPRFLKVATHRYVPIEDVIAAHLNYLFVGMDIVETYVFRVTRIRELEVDEDVTENLLQAMERELAKRRFEPAVRLEVADDMSDDVLSRLARELGVDENAVSKVTGPLDLTGLTAIADLPRGELRYPGFVPTRGRCRPDLDVRHPSRGGRARAPPYDSFTATVERLIEEAAADPAVLAIKQTLYRTSGASPIVDALIDAAEAGKEVVVVVEIKARFDEKRQHRLGAQARGVGLPRRLRLRRHKDARQVVLIVRRNPTAPCAGTATSAPATTTPRRRGFMRTSACSPPTRRSARTSPTCSTTSRLQQDKRLPAAARGPGGAAGRDRRAGSGGRRAAPGRASPPGSRSSATRSSTRWSSTRLPGVTGRACRSTCWVRGMCALRPGVPGLSDSISVRSVLGRFLEHSRVYAFGTGDPDPGAEPGEDPQRQRGLARQRGHDAPEPGPSRGIPGQGGRSGALQQAPRPDRRRHG